MSWPTVRIGSGLQFNVADCNALLLPVLFHPWQRVISRGVNLKWKSHFTGLKVKRVPLPVTTWVLHLVPLHLKICFFLQNCKSTNKVRESDTCKSLISSMNAAKYWFTRSMNIGYMERTFISGSANSQLFRTLMHIQNINSRGLRILNKYLLEDEIG